MIEVVREIKGAYFSYSSKGWVGQIRFDGKLYRSKPCKTEAEAKAWYRKKSLELYGYDRFAPPKRT